MYTWRYGRQLYRVKNGSTTVATFRYNDEGIRTVKVANGIRHEYDVMGGQINREVIRSSSDASSPVLKDIRYYYDASGKPIAIRAFTRTSSSADFTDTIYYLQTNLQGDVVAIYNQSGTKIYEYAYDAWGNIIKSAEVVTGGNAAHAVNPFRYRGYYFDTETNLYYLQSRYYNPEWGRFLNADVYVNANGDLMGYNMYAYCSNNPVMCSDPSGKIPIAIPIILGVCGLSGAGLGVWSGLNEYDNEMAQKEKRVHPRAQNKNSEPDSFERTLRGIKGGVIGTGLGITVGGTAIIFGAMGATFLGSTMVFGYPIQQATAIGILAHNVTPFIILPIFGNDIDEEDKMGGIEMEPIQTPKLNDLPGPYKHPIKH